MSKYTHVAPPLPAITRGSTVRDEGATASAASKNLFPSNPAESSDDGTFNFDRIVKLLTGKHSCDDRERHIHALSRMSVWHVKSCYRMDEYEVVGRIATICLEKSCKGLNPSYMDAFCDIMAPLTRLKQGESSSGEMSKRVLSLFNVLARGISESKSPKVWRNLSKNVINCCRADDFLVSQIGASHIAVALVRAIRQACTNIRQSGSVPLVNLLFTLAEVTRNVVAAEKICTSEESLVSDIICVLSKSNDDDLTATTMEVLWNLVEHGGSCAQAVREQTLAQRDSGDGARTTGTPLNVLEKCLHRLLTAARSVATKELRNDLAMLLLNCLQSSDTANAIGTSSAIVEHMARALSATDLPSKHPDCRTMKYGTEAEDFEFHKIAIEFVERAAEFPSCRNAVTKGKVLLLLFHYLNCKSSACGSETEASSSRVWTAPQREELELLSVRAIGCIGGYMADGFLQLRGPTQMLRYLEWCTDETSPSHDVRGLRLFRGAGNSALSAGDFNVPVGNGHGNSDDALLRQPSPTRQLMNNGRRAHLLQGVRALRRLTHHDTDAATADRIVRDFVDQGVIDQLVLVLHQEVDGADSFDLSIREEALHSLARICASDVHNKELFGEAGVSMLMRYLNINPEIFARGIGHKGVVLAAIDLAWHGVVGSNTNTIAFLQQSGLFALLDLLDTCPPDMWNLVLGCTVDLCDAAPTHATAHVRQWRSARAGVEGYTAAHLLIDVFVHEEQRLGTLSAANDHAGVVGCAAHDPHPLMPVTWTVGDIDGAQGSIAEVTSSLRSKIFSLFTITGFDGYDSVTGQDQAVLEKIKAYLTLKVGEIWSEIEHSLGKDGIEPIETDAELLRAMRAGGAHHVEALRDRQLNILADTKQADMDHLDKHFEDVRDRHLGAQEVSRKHTEFLRRTADYTTLQRVRHEQRTSRTASRQRNRAESDAMGAARSTDEGVVVQHGEDSHPDAFTSTVVPPQVLLTGLLLPGTDGTAEDDRQLELDTSGVFVDPV
eukprot:m.712524 g.712524  ORF g.712524 m.712524 type:complete len:1004 (+) comp22962_c0_seq1:267-3278(+)